MINIGIPSKGRLKEDVIKIFKETWFFIDGAIFVSITIASSTSIVAKYECSQVEIKRNLFRGCSHDNNKKVYIFILFYYN